VNWRSRHLDEDLAIASHLRRAKGKSVRYLGLRYLRALNGFLEDVESAPDEVDYPELPLAQIAGLKIVAQVCAERLRHEEAPESLSEHELVGGALGDALGALERIVSGVAPAGIKRRYAVNDRIPPYVLVWAVLAEISERGKME
jgi:hypothetical protein